MGTTIRYFGIACWLVLASTAHALVGGAEPAKNDTRFDAVAAFGETANLLTGHNTFGNGTLITPTKMLMARHIIRQWGVGNQPPSGFYSFRFRRNVDGTLGRREDGPASFHHVEVVGFTFHGSGIQGETPDLVIAHLAEPVTHIEPIAVAHKGFLAPGMDITIAAWGNEVPGDTPSDQRGRLKLATNPVVTSSSGDLQICSTIRAETTNGHVAYLDSGGAMLVMSNLVPYPYGYILDDPPYTGESSGTSYVPMQIAPGATPIGGEPKPVLVGVIYTVGNSGVYAYQHEALDPCVYNECTRETFSEAGCNLPMDLNGDFVVDEVDLDLALDLWLGPCGPHIDPRVCSAIDDPSGDFGGNGDGILQEAEITAYIVSGYGERCECLEDIDGDGDVDAVDAATVYNAMRECDCADPCREDVNLDRRVDMDDVLQVLAEFGICDH